MFEIKELPPDHIDISKEFEAASLPIILKHYGEIAGLSQEQIKMLEEATKHDCAEAQKLIELFEESFDASKWIERQKEAFAQNDDRVKSGKISEIEREIEQAKAHQFKETHQLTNLINIIAYICLYNDISAYDLMGSRIHQDVYSKFIRERIGTTHGQIGAALRYKPNTDWNEYESRNKKEAEAIHQFIRGYTDRDDLTVIRPSGINEKVERFLLRYPVSTIILVDPGFKDDESNIAAVEQEIKSLDETFKKEKISPETLQFSFKYKGKEIKILLVAKMLTRETIKDFPEANIFEQGGTTEGTDSLEFLQELKKHMKSPGFVVVTAHSANQSYRQFVQAEHLQLFGIDQDLLSENIDLGGSHGGLTPQYHIIIPMAEK